MYWCVQHIKLPTSSCLKGFCHLGSLSLQIGTKLMEAPERCYKLTLLLPAGIKGLMLLFRTLVNDILNVFLSRRWYIKGFYSQCYVKMQVWPRPLDRRWWNTCSGEHVGVSFTPRKNKMVSVNSHIFVWNLTRFRDFSFWDTRRKNCQKWICCKGDWREDNIQRVKMGVWVL